MKIINQSCEIIPEEYTLEGVYKHIEIAARNCYKSEDKISEGSAKKMVDFLIKNKHYGMLRHGTIYLKMIRDTAPISFYKHNHYSDVTIKPLYVYITTNYLVLLENNRLDDLKFICAPIKGIHELKTTFSFTTSIAINREIQTHDGLYGRARAEESTRYCNYSKDRFGRELTFIIPQWTTKELLEKVNNINNIYEEILKEDQLIQSWEDAESNYFEMIERGCSPQEARDVLPLSTKSTLIYTLFDSDWEHVFDIRTSRNPGAHPMIKQLMDKAEILFNYK